MPSALAGGLRGYPLCVMAGLVVQPGDIADGCSET